MERSRSTDEQSIAVLREQGAGLATAEVCREHGVTGATFHAWKARCGGLDVSQARELKVLEGQNARLKRFLAEAVLDNAALRDVTAKRGGAHGALGGRGARGRCPASRSGGRARRPASTGRRSARRRGGRGEDAGLRGRPRDSAGQRRRFGWRRLRILLAREGIAPNHQRLRRIHAGPGKSDEGW